MKLFFKLFSSKMIWILFTVPMIFHIHYKLTKDTMNSKSLEIDLFGVLENTINIAEREEFPYIFKAYYIISLIGIIVLGIVFHNILRNVFASSVVNNFDANKVESKVSIAEIEELLNGGSVMAQPKKILIQKDETPNTKKPPEDGRSVENDENIDDLFCTTKEIKSIKINSKKSKTIDDYLMELQNMIGLDTVKKEINSIINFIRVNQMKIEKGLETYDLSYHMVFTGNPGTGKTSVARILSNIFKELNIVSIGSYFEVDRLGLVAGYMGQTALKVKGVLDDAKGGVLFIDEAYSLVNDSSGSDYGKEAIDTLLKYMEDYRSDLIVIVAGYSEPMKNFINSNPGLKSRFNRFINFEDYTPEELLEILKSISNKANYSFSEKALVYLKKFFLTVYQNDRERFGNGRGVRNLFEKILTFHADRMSNFVVPSDELLCVIVAEDVVKAIREMLRNKM